ncbi:Uncharacterised protein [Mycoplasmopsis bovigenitalium]|uniref:Uncharacterized protein n=1 Tax=Mycoplasmopsis bovigenitalium TaxID=2112 RepID=A0A449A8W8_9BACT|nr:lipoprotein 17-related variable surface protein [Mycoplasmopsis bovigenitalium]VEU60616.1 Uncharacterised protein [Mycoplasmopsis bovigenitalium]
MNLKIIKNTISTIAISSMPLSVVSCAKQQVNNQLRITINNINFNNRVDFTLDDINEKDIKTQYNDTIYKEVKIKEIKKDAAKGILVVELEATKTNGEIKNQTITIDGFKKSLNNSDFNSKIYFEVNNYEAENFEYLKWEDPSTFLVEDMKINYSKTGLNSNELVDLKNEIIDFKTDDENRTITIKYKLSYKSNAKNIGEFEYIIKFPEKEVH